MGKPLPTVRRSQPWVGQAPVPTPAPKPRASVVWRQPTAALAGQALLARLPRANPVVTARVPRPIEVVRVDGRRRLSLIYGFVRVHRQLFFSNPVLMGTAFILESLTARALAQESLTATVLVED